MICKQLACNLLGKNAFLCRSPHVFPRALSQGGWHDFGTETECLKLMQDPGTKFFSSKSTLLSMICSGFHVLNIVAFNMAMACHEIRVQKKTLCKKPSSSTAGDNSFERASTKRIICEET